SQAATRNRSKAIANSPPLTYDSEPKQVADNEASSKEKEIDKLMALISMSFKKIHKPTNNNLRTSSNTKNMNIDNTLRSDRRIRNDRQTKQYDNTRAVNVVGASENVERDLLASLIEKLKCEIDDNKIWNRSLESSNKAFKESNKELGEANKSLIKDLDKNQVELDKYKNMKFVKDAENDCAKAYGLLAQQKVTYEKSFNDYIQKINRLNQKLSEKEKELSADQRTISTISYEKEAQEKFLKKAQSEIPRLYDIGCYNDNLALMLAHESDETIRLDQESRSKLSDLI
ncbi:hypothetical protein Tco_0898032, partial [Tanacetum coccineum]